VTVRITESRIPNGYNASELGQVNQATTADGGKYILVSFNTPPLRTDTEQQYVLFAIDADADEYRWTIEPIGGPALRTDTTEIGVLTHRFTNPDSYEVRVDVMVDGVVAGTPLLLQTVTPPDSALEQNILAEKTDASSADVLRELRVDFGGYVQQAATATGPNGVPSRFVSAILFQEILSTPKRGSAGASAPAAAGAARSKIREEEIDWLANQYQLGRPPFGTAGSPPDPMTLGPGQLGEWRVASMEGLINWREGAAQGAGSDRAMWLDRKFVLFLDVSQFVNFTAYQEQVDCFNLCRFPKTSIAQVAKLLARLKNRPHRWPNVPRTDFFTEPDLLEIVATEYRIGPRATPAASAKPDIAYSTFARFNSSSMGFLDQALFP
jgi:hypothetical protein